jgi:hypothetical protein
MKGIITGSLLLIFACTLNAQKSIDALFDKYEGSDDYVCITINADLIRIAKALNCLGDDLDCWPSNISRIRILTQEKNGNHYTNFYKMVERELDRKNYDEIMRIKKSDQDLVLLARAEGRSYKELLLVGGGQDNLIIQFKGNMTFREVRKLADKLNKDHQVNIDIDWD